MASSDYCGSEVRHCARHWHRHRPQRIKEANENLRKAGVGERVRFVNADLFESDLSDATVITLYLLPELNLKLLPKLLKEVKPGTRIVSHAFDMGTWKPAVADVVGARFTSG